MANPIADKIMDLVMEAVNECVQPYKDRIIELERLLEAKDRLIDVLRAGNK